MTGNPDNGHGPEPGRGGGAGALAAFEEHRNLLFSIAYRMLGSVADGEDILQEAYLRWQGASETEIRSPRAFLVTIVTRLCINHLQSARLQREAYVGEWLPEPLLTGPGSDASAVVQADESAERAVFLLHEVFEYRHAEIAAAVALTEAHCRQLLRRAQRRVRETRPRFQAPAREHRELLESFAEAAGSGDMGHLLSLLSGDVVLHADGGGKASALLLPIYGADNVARASVYGLGRLRSLGVQQRFVEINGRPGILSYLNGRPQSTFTIEASEGRIRAIYIVTNPEKLAHLPSQEPF
jgi:RNA polymerase sigma-70 factor (ECF subfamily)